MVLSEGAVLLPVEIWTEPTIYTQDAVAGGKDFHWKIHFSFTAMRDQQKTTTGGVIGGLMNGGLIFGEREMLQERDVDVGGKLLGERRCDKSQPGR